VGEVDKKGPGSRKDRLDNRRMPKTRNRYQRRAEKTDARQQRVEEGRGRQKKRASLSKTLAAGQE
jgi:hypothetical protein